MLNHWLEMTEKRQEWGEKLNDDFVHSQREDHIVYCVLLVLSSLLELGKSFSITLRHDSNRPFSLELAHLCPSSYLG